ncbi:unnamed protein product, partial [Ilex paraguariensis]
FLGADYAGLVLNHLNEVVKTSLKLTTAASRYCRSPSVCSYGGKEKSENDNEASPWKSLEKAMGSLKKEQSLEDELRNQIQKQEYYDDGGGGRTPPGGSGDGSGGSDDDGLSGIWDELLQVVLATTGFIFLVVSFSISPPPPKKKKKMDIYEHRCFVCQKYYWGLVNSFYSPW